jgi:uncharacterized membrane protein YphA (DoxX/SURF4 family)
VASGWRNQYHLPGVQRLERAVSLSEETLMVLSVQAGGEPGTVLKVAFLAGRVLFGWFFLKSGYGHLVNLQAMAQYATMNKVPAPKLAVGVTGLMLLAGGLSVLLGVYVPIGMILLVVFLVPTAFMMHNYWGLSDPMAAAGQAAQFWKNITLAGAALMILYLSQVNPGAWILSLKP